ncbi:LysM domain-containing protein [Chryseobacterium carnipullorum]|uniref:LysM peptidoglycan-binding domain-containing protein n=1 Tax=Chryseobacterium carnipullorum TaxID=1124835 RepID=UPI00091F3D96|nr:LysM peptidoglycan-binding domain-containing protein [Chryseobacterium carnipullorum]SHM14945.1 LysM domain-containing protein [Chryseobacterium carnipullorum]
MEFIKYEIQKGDTLKSIAEKYDLDANEMKIFHNENCGITGIILNDDLPLHLKYILINKNIIHQKKKNKAKSGELDFNQQARYRCEQINTSKFNNNLVHYVEQHFQYLLKHNLSLETGYVKLEDYNKEISPKFLEETFDFIEKTDRIKNNVLFNLDIETGKPKQILNKKEINDNWLYFKQKEFYNIPFIKKIGETNRGAVEELLDMGDQQFSLSANNEEEYWRDFFYFCCFDQYLFKESQWENVKFDFISTIVPPIIIPLNLRYDKIDENDGIVSIRKVAEYEMSEKLLTEIRNRYDELHRAVVKYDFTAYKIIFRSTIEMNTKTKTINNARVVLKEEISDNIENECIFTVKKLENFTP